MKISDVLTDESKWTKGYSARDARGQYVSPLSDAACSFCLRGAIERAGESHSHESEMIRTIEDYVAQLPTAPHYIEGSGHCSMVMFNDSETTQWSDIKKMLEELGL